MNNRTIESDLSAYQSSNHGHTRRINFAKFFNDIKKKTKPHRQVTFSSDPPRVYEYEAEYERPLLIRTCTIRDLQLYCDDDSDFKANLRPRRCLDLRPVPNNAFYSQPKHEQQHDHVGSPFTSLFTPVQRIQLFPPSPPPSPNASTTIIELSCTSDDIKPIVARTLTRLRSSRTLLQRIF